MKLVLLCVAAILIPAIFSCPFGNIWDYPTPTTVSLGEQATFYCYGDGSYLYWFIDGVNFENITSDELETRGISFSGYYNHYPPYYYNCEPQYSDMSIAGNCLNNNTEVYCIVLGYEYPYNSTSSTVALTVQDNSEVITINEFKLLSVTTNSIVMTWDITPVLNSTLTLNITDTYHTVNGSINVTGVDNVHTYIEVSPDPCNIYTFKLTPQPLLAGCNNISIITAEFLLKPENISVAYNYSNLKVYFQIHQCFRNHIQLLLIDADGTTSTSDLFPINSLRYTDHQFYEVHWTAVQLTRHSLYYLNILAMDTHRTGISDGIKISTFDVQDLIVTRDGANVCVTCVLTTLSDSCLIVVRRAKTFIQPYRSLHNGTTCYSFTENGTYYIYGYDYGEDGVMSLRSAAVVKELIIDWIPLPVSSPVFYTTTTGSSADLFISSNNQDSGYVVLSSNTLSAAIQVEGQSHLVPVLGVLFSLTTIGMFILTVLLLIVMCYKRRGTHSSNNNRQQQPQHQYDDPVTIIKQDTAYELTKLGNDQPTDDINVNVYEAAHPLPSQLYQNVQFLPQRAY